MKYKAYLNFHMSSDGKSKAYENSNLPVLLFQVDGGASRIIDLRASDDISLLSELEQARSFKNIILYLSATRDQKDVKAAIDLTAIALNEFYLRAFLVIERFSGGKMIEGLAIFMRTAKLKHPPRTAFNNTLMATLDIYYSEIYRGKVQNHFMPEVEEL